MPKQPVRPPLAPPTGVPEAMAHTIEAANAAREAELRAQNAAKERELQPEPEAPALPPLAPSVAVEDAPAPIAINPGCCPRCGNAHLARYASTDTCNLCGWTGIV